MSDKLPWEANSQDEKIDKIDEKEKSIDKIDDEKKEVDKVIENKEEKEKVVSIDEGKNKEGHNALEREIIKGIDAALNGIDNPKPQFTKGDILSKFKNAAFRLDKLQVNHLKKFGTDNKLSELIYNSIMNEKKKQMQEAVDSQFRGMNFQELLATEVYLGMVTMQNYSSRMKAAIDSYNKCKPEDIDDKAVLKNMILESYKNSESWGADTESLMKMIVDNLPVDIFGKNYQELC